MYLKLYIFSKSSMFAQMGWVACLPARSTCTPAARHWPAVRYGGGGGLRGAGGAAGTGASFMPPPRPALHLSAAHWIMQQSFSLTPHPTPLLYEPANLPLSPLLLFNIHECWAFLNPLYFFCVSCAITATFMNRFRWLVFVGKGVAVLFKIEVNEHVAAHTTGHKNIYGSHHLIRQLGNESGFMEFLRL